MNKTQSRIKDYLAKRKWDKNEPVDLAKSIVIEGAELLEVFQWTNKKRKEVLTNKKMIDELKGELADVFIYAYGMAITLGLDADEVIMDKLEKVEKKYPADKITANRNEYLKIKRVYRENRKS